jgi:hypothetical protein
MNAKFTSVSVVCFALSLAACKTPLPAVGPTVLPSKYSCLTFPNSADQAGSVLRTVDSTIAAQANISDDNLVRAFTPNIFQKLGVALNVDANATYTITIKATDNKQYTADDDQRLATLKTLYDTEKRVEGARYFFVKEAVGSSNIDYRAKTKVAIAGTASMSANKSSLSANVTAKDATTSVGTTNKELIACVVLEEFKFDVVHAADGHELLSVKPLATTLQTAQAQSILESAVKK